MTQPLTPIPSDTTSEETAKGSSAPPIMPDPPPIDASPSSVREIEPAPRTPHTVTGKRELKRILTEASQNGYALECDQTDLGVSCIGAPVFDSERVVAAVSLSLPTARAEKNLTRLITLVRETANRLTSRLRAAPL